MPESTEPAHDQNGSHPAADPLAGMSAAALFERVMHDREAGDGSSTAPRVWQPPSPRDLQKLLTDWEIFRLLGRGGMGAVYQARCRRTGREVAVKILPPEFSSDPFFVERFQREAAMMTRCEHANIVSVLEPARVAGGVLFFVMEFVDGVDLARHQRGAPMPADAALKIFRQVCDALDHAHSLGVVHRDLKPANVLVDPDGRIKVTDFGLAQTLVEGGGSSCTMTLTGQVLGTVDYLAPEQIDGRPVDHRADLYAAGVLLYQMLTGHPPRGSWHPPSAVSGADRRLDTVVNKALRENPDARYASAAALKADLEAASLPRRSTRSKIAAAVFMTCVVAIPAVFMAWPRSSPAPRATPPRIVKPRTAGTALILAELAGAKLGEVPSQWSAGAPVVHSGPDGVTIEMTSEIEGHIPVWHERLDLSACREWFLAADVVIGPGNRSPDVLVRMETADDALRLYALPLTGLEPGRETRVITQRPLADPGQYTMWGGRILTPETAARRFAINTINRLQLHVWPRLRSFPPLEVTVKRLVLIAPEHARAGPLPWFPSPHPDRTVPGRIPVPEKDGTILLADLSRHEPDMLAPGWFDEKPVTTSAGLHLHRDSALEGSARIVHEPLNLGAANGWHLQVDFSRGKENTASVLELHLTDSEQDRTTFDVVVEGPPEVTQRWISTVPLQTTSAFDLDYLTEVWLVGQPAKSPAKLDVVVKSLRLVPPGARDARE